MAVYICALIHYAIIVHMTQCVRIHTTITDATQKVDVFFLKTHLKISTSYIRQIKSDLVAEHSVIS